jgi:hypothetical protein
MWRLPSAARAFKCCWRIWIRARALSQSAEAPLSAESLPEALESARSSLEGALQLSQDLLEAVRQSSAQAAAKQSLKP